MSLPRLSLGVLLLAGLTACQTSSGEAPSPLLGGDSQETGTSEAKTLVHCEHPLGSATIVEPEANAMAALQTVGLQSPTPVLRIMIGDSNCFRFIDRGAARGAAVQYAITPNIILSNPDAGGFNPSGIIGGVAGFVPGGTILSSAAGSVRVKEAETALFLSDGRTGEQLAAVQGKARATDFSISFAGIGGGLNSVGGYSNTPEGKVVMAAYLDAYNKLVAQLQKGKAARVSRTP